MWTAIRTTLSQWYIAGIGIFLIAGGLFLASHWSSSPAPVAGAQDHQSPALEIAARASPPALPAMPKATATAAPSAPSIQQPSAPASAPVLDHTMAQGMTPAPARQDHPRSFARRYSRPQGRIRPQLQLLAGDEAGQHCLGCQVVGRLFARSAEGRSREQDAVPRP